MNIFPTNAHLREGGLMLNLDLHLCQHKGAPPRGFVSSGSVTSSGAAATARAVTGRVPREALAVPSPPQEQHKRL